MLAKSALEQQAKPPESPKQVVLESQVRKPPAQQEAKPQAKGDEVLKLALPIPENTRPVSNIAARAALFAAIQGGDRQQFKKAVLASQDGIQIIFTGEQLNQDDHDLFMQLIYMANHKALGELVKVPANAILAGLGRGIGGQDHERLKNEMHRLVTGTVNLKAYGINYIGHLLDDAFQDEMEAQHNRHWHYRLNPKLAAIFGKSQFSLIDWEQRKKLKRKDLARFIQLYILSHANPFPVSVAFLHRISGSQTKELWKFRENLLEKLLRH